MSLNSVGTSCGRIVVIDSLPRVGSTSLARAINTNPETPCLLEPFHPKRYQGTYHRMALTSGSARPALHSISARFVVVKHVWEEWGWPFAMAPYLNDEIVMSAYRVISLRRHNLLKRYVSNAISRHLNFWVGTKQDFASRLSSNILPELNVSVALESIRRDALALEKRERLFSTSNTPALTLEYEELFAPDLQDSSQLSLLNTIFSFIDVAPISLEHFRDHAARFFRQSLYRWADQDLYLRLPNVRELDRVIGNEGFGRLLP